MSVGSMTADLKKMFERLPSEEDANTVDLPTVGGSVSLANYPTNKGAKPDPEQETLFHPEHNSGTSLKNYPEDIGEAGVMPNADDENLIAQSTKTSITLPNSRPVNPGALQPIGKTVAKTAVPTNADPSFITPSRMAGVSLKNYPVGSEDQGSSPYKVVEAGLFKPASDDSISARKEATPVLPVDKDAMKLANKMWSVVDVLKGRMWDLQKVHDSDKGCICDFDRLQEEGIDEFVSIPGDEMMLYNACLRCGGYRDDY